MGVTPELKAAALDIVSGLRMGPLYMPPSVADPDGTMGTVVLPGSLGGANWPGGSVDAENGIMFITSVTSPSIHGLASDPDYSNMDYVGGRGMRLFGRSSLRGLPLVKPPWGRVTAIDLNRGEILWQVVNGDTPDFVKEHPLLEGVEFAPTGRPDRGGTMVTSTLMFAGEGGGMFSARRRRQPAARLRQDDR